MKRIILTFISIVFAYAMTSCDKARETDYYSYYVSFGNHYTSFMPEVSDFSAIDEAIESRINIPPYELTRKEAEAEWQSFLDSVDESRLVINEGDYYTVKFCREEIRGNRFEPVETIGEKTWGHKK